MHSLWSTTVKRYRYCTIGLYKKSHSFVVRVGVSFLERGRQVVSSFMATQKGIFSV